MWGLGFGARGARLVRWKVGFRARGLSFVFRVSGVGFWGWRSGLGTEPCQEGPYEKRLSFWNRKLFCGWHVGLLEGRL